MIFAVNVLAHTSQSAGAISRCRKFATTAQTENQDGEDIEPPQYWPSQGVITVDCVSASYRYTPRILAWVFGPA